MGCKRAECFFGFIFPSGHAARFCDQEQGLRGIAKQQTRPFRLLASSPLFPGGERNQNARDRPLTNGDPTTLTPLAACPGDAANPAQDSQDDQDSQDKEA